MTFVVWVQVPPPVPFPGMDFIMTKIEEIKNKGLDVEWNMTIPADKINVILDKKYQELSQNIKIPGFRPGKVPISIIKKDIPSL